MVNVQRFGLVDVAKGLVGQQANLTDPEIAEDLRPDAVVAKLVQAEAGVGARLTSRIFDTREEIDTVLLATQVEDHAATLVGDEFSSQPSGSMEGDVDAESVADLDHAFVDGQPIGLGTGGTHHRRQTSGPKVPTKQGLGDR